RGFFLFLFLGCHRKPKTSLRSSESRFCFVPVQALSEWDLIAAWFAQDKSDGFMEGRAPASPAPTISVAELRPPPPRKLPIRKKSALLNDCYSFKSRSSW